MPHGRWLAVWEVTASIRCIVTMYSSMATKFSEMSILRLANAIAVDGMVVESDPFGSGRPSIGFKYLQIDTRPAITELKWRTNLARVHFLHFCTSSHWKLNSTALFATKIGLSLRRLLSVILPSPACTAISLIMVSWFSVMTARVGYTFSLFFLLSKVCWFLSFSSGDFT